MPHRRETADSQSAVCIKWRAAGMLLTFIANFVNQLLALCASEVKSLWSVGSLAWWRDFPSPVGQICSLFSRNSNVAQKAMTHLAQNKGMVRPVLQL